MKRPIYGQTYRLQETSSGGWTLQTKIEYCEQGNIRISAGELLTCLQVCSRTVRRRGYPIDLHYGIWLVRGGIIAYDTAVPVELNAHEDNIMNVLVEV